MLFVSMLMVNYILFFYAKFNYRKVLLLMMIGFTVVIGINSLKHELKADGELYNSLGNKYLLVNQAQILYGGAAAVGAVDDQLFSAQDRVLAAGGLVVQSIVLPSLLPREIKYPAILHDRVDFGGGGLFIFVIYIAFGPLGLLAFGGILAYATSKLCTNPLEFGKYTLLFFILSLALATRWISYDFNLMYRLPLVTCLFLALVEFSVVRKKNI